MPDVVVKDATLPTGEYRDRVRRAALEIETEPLEEAAERKDVDESIEPSVAPEGFHRLPIRLRRQWSPRSAPPSGNGRGGSRPRTWGLGALSARHVAFAAA
jgi:hypothetical protein